MVKVSEYFKLIVDDATEQVDDGAVVSDHLDQFFSLLSATKFRFMNDG